jgi:hypothetical protein
LANALEYIKLNLPIHVTEQCTLPIPISRGIPWVTNRPRIAFRPEPMKAAKFFPSNMHVFQAVPDREQSAMSLMHW